MSVVGLGQCHDLGLGRVARRTHPLGPALVARTCCLVQLEVAVEAFAPGQVVGLLTKRHQEPAHIGEREVDRLVLLLVQVFAPFFRERDLSRNLSSLVILVGVEQILDVRIRLRLLERKQPNIVLEAGQGTNTIKHLVDHEFFEVQLLPAVGVDTGRVDQQREHVFAILEDDAWNVELLCHPVHDIARTQVFDVGDVRVEDELDRCNGIDVVALVVTLRQHEQILLDGVDWAERCWLFEWHGTTPWNWVGDHGDVVCFQIR